MKFDPKCVRAILLALEETETINQEGFLENYSLKPFFQNKHVQGYDKSQLRYTLRMLNQAGYVSYTCFQKMGRTLALDFSGEDGLTYSGHQLLASIRNDTVWKSVLEKAEKVGNFAPLTILLEFALEAIRKKTSD